MKLNDINSGENEQKEVENKYIPGSSEKKRACMMYLFFGILVSISKKEFSPFEFYHLKQAIGLWIVLLPIILISFVPILKWIGILILVILLGILGWSFANAFNGMYFESSKNIALTLPAGIGGWFLDLFELGIKSTGVDKRQTTLTSSSEIEKDIAEEQNNITTDNTQTQDTSIEKNIGSEEEKLDSNIDEGK